MDSRQELILSTIVKEHIKTGQPVSSSALVDKYKLAVSSATVRNEMAALEEAGYIRQPHTSAGRVPTAKAYLWLADNLQTTPLTEAEEQALAGALPATEPQTLKQTAKALAESSGLAVFWVFHKHNVYYTGISNLLEKPEFAQPGLFYNFSAIIDRLDEIINDNLLSFNVGPQIMVGEQGPFGDFCSAVLAKYRLGDYDGAFGILGPLRMDYGRNLALVECIYKRLI